MLKKIAYVLIPVSMSCSVAVADSSPVLLSAEQMDQVTAGLGSYANATTNAFSPYLVLTGAEAVASTSVSSVGNPALGGYAEYAGGGATAMAAGTGSTTNTSVTAGTSSAGMPGSVTFNAGGHMTGQLVEINASAQLTLGSIFINPI